MDQLHLRCVTPSMIVKFDMVLRANEGKEDALHPSSTHPREFVGDDLNLATNYIR